jgi:endonuclease III
MDRTDARMDIRAYLTTIRDILLPIWPDAVPLLNYGSCFELLCSVILSAQCTDAQVNAVTPALFARFPDPITMASATAEQIEPLIHSVGFFHTKARHLVETARKLVADFSGEVPHSIDALLQLPGVGRKTANLVSSSCFNVPGVIVDTHVIRVAYRLGISEKKDPVEIERIIRSNAAEKDFTALSHALNRHGKFVCTARNPACVQLNQPCPLVEFCPKTGLVAL